MGKKRHFKRTAAFNQKVFACPVLAYTPFIYDAISRIEQYKNKSISFNIIRTTGINTDKIQIINFHLPQRSGSPEGSASFRTMAAALTVLVRRPQVITLDISSSSQFEQQLVYSHRSAWFNKECLQSHSSSDRLKVESTPPESVSRLEPGPPLRRRPSGGIDTPSPYFHNVERPPIGAFTGPASVTGGFGYRCDAPRSPPW